MQRLISFTALSLITFFYSAAFGQKDNSEMNKKNPNVVVRVETQINAPADQVWQVLGKEFADIAHWTSLVESSKAVAVGEIPAHSPYTPAADAPIPARQTTSVNKGRTATLIEVVTMYSDEKRELKFYGVGLPKFIAFGGDKQSVVANSEATSTVIFNVELRLKGFFKLLKGKIEKRFAENLKKLQEDLKVYIEAEKIISGK